MEKKLFHLAVVLILTAVAGSTALAIAPLGPPTAGLEQGQKRVAFEYGYREGDLEASGAKSSDWGDDVEVSSSAFIANIGYGATESWEVYALLGAADIEIAGQESGGPDPLFDGTYDPYFGFGTKYTFRKEESLSWGAMFQMDWTYSDDDEAFEFELDLFGTDIDVEVSYYEIIIAVGPTYEMNEKFRLYGGPFFYLLDGEYEVDVRKSDSGAKASVDLAEESQFGGYVGAEIDLTENAPIIVELQFTPDSWGFGAGIGWKF